MPWRVGVHHFVLDAGQRHQITRNTTRFVPLRSGEKCPESRGLAMRDRDKRARGRPVFRQGYTTLR